MAIRLSSGSRRQQSPEGLPLHLLNRFSVAPAAQPQHGRRCFAPCDLNISVGPGLPDWPRGVEVSGTSGVVVPPFAVLQGLSRHFVFSIGGHRQPMFGSSCE